MMTRKKDANGAPAVETLPPTPEEMVPAERNDQMRTELGVPLLPPQDRMAQARAARGKKRTSRERTYWVRGRAHDSAPWQHLIPAETIGRARKNSELVKRMPPYAGWQFQVTAEVVRE